jgi:hypothetical protein
MNGRMWDGRDRDAVREGLIEGTFSHSAHSIYVSTWRHGHRGCERLALHAFDGRRKKDVRRSKYSVWGNWIRTRTAASETSIQATSLHLVSTQPTGAA